MKYPVPDRSKIKRSLHKNMETGETDIGWNSGYLADKRPYQAECWALDGITMLTYFFSIVGLENHTKEELMDLLIQDGALIVTDRTRARCGALPWMDAQGNLVWSVNLMVGEPDSDETFCTDTAGIRRYETVSNQPGRV